ncbi:MAG: monovalent cation/H(+) antiporter subunit G [Maricaulaceae bacterium]
MSTFSIIIMAASETVHHASDPINWEPILTGLRAVIAGGSIIAGMFFVLAGTLGVLRLPDFYTRLHAAGMTDTLGAELILVGLIIQSGFTQMSLKLALASFFLLLTSPTATHAVANAAYKAGLKPKLGKYKAPALDAIAAPKGGQ